MEPSSTEAAPEQEGSNGPAEAKSQPDQDQAPGAEADIAGPGRGDVKTDVDAATLAAVQAAGKKAEQKPPKKPAMSKEFIVVALLFLLSGLSSLIYQVIWTRMLVFIFGSTTFATSTVLTVFMGGLALGSFVAGRKADRMKNPFLWYGILEGIIGLWAVLAPFMFEGAIPIYKALWQQMHMSVVPFSLLRFAVAAIILLPPTACMGATLPLLSRFVTTSLDVVGDRVGTLYAINTLGAVIGSLMAGFFLLPTFGLQTTIAIAAGINISLTGIVYFLAKQWSSIAPDTAPDTAPEAPAPSAPAKKLPLPVLVTMISFAFSGAVAMIYEVGWTRTLLMIIGSTTYAFSIMLSTFLIGIFLGSFICARFVDRLKEPVVWFGAMEIILCLAGLVSMVLFNFVPYWNLVVNRQYFQNPEAGMLIRFLFSGVIMVPITLALGAIFPIAVKACTQELAKVGRSVGTLYSINTLGAIIGAFTAGFIIIPSLGTEKALILASVANLLLGMAILIPFGNLKTSIKGFALLGTGFIAVWALQQPVIWDQLLLLSSQKERRSLGFVNYEAEVPSFKDWAELMRQTDKIMFWKDGLCAHVAILKVIGSGKFALMTSGHTDASDDLDMINQAMPPSYALLLKPQSDDVCVIGWGSGVMNGYALQFPIKKMVAVEIEEEVFKASEFFHHVNLEPEKDPRTRLEVNDGRNYLLATDEKFDVICSQPSNPWQAGVCNLFTADSFKVCRDRLKPGGIFAMWFQQAEVSHDNLCRVLSALKAAFPHVLVFQTDENDICALACEQPLKINLKQIEEKLKDPRVAKAMQRFGVETPEDLVALVEMAPSEVDAVTKDFAPNSDNMNHLEYDVSKTYEQRQFIKENREWINAHHGPLWDAVDWGNMTVDRKAEKCALIGERALAFMVPRGLVWARESIRLHDNAHAHAVLGLGYSELGEYEKAFAEMNRAVAISPNEIRFLQARALIELKASAFGQARADLQKIVALDKDNKLAKYRLAQTYSLFDTEDRHKQAIKPKEAVTSEPEKVLALAGDLVRDPEFVKKHPGVLLIVGNAYHELNRDKDARPLLDEYLKRIAQDLYGWRLQSNVLANLGDSAASSYCWAKSLNLGANFARSMVRRAEGLINEGKSEDAFLVLRRTIEVDPDSIRARQLLGRLYQGKVPGVEELLERLAKYNPRDAQFLAELRQNPAPTP